MLQMIPLMLAFSVEDGFLQMQCSRERENIAVSYAADGSGAYQAIMSIQITQPGLNPEHDVSRYAPERPSLIFHSVSSQNNKFPVLRH